MQHGYIKVASAIPGVRVADVDYNLGQIQSLIAQAEGKQVEIIVFPELCLTGYTCQDLFAQQLLLDQAERAVMMLIDFTRQLDIISVVGVPVMVGNLLLNCAAVIQKGSLLGIVAKTHLPNYSEFYEKRWFASARDLKPTEVRFAGQNVTVSSQPQLFATCDGALFGVEICEDLWSPLSPGTCLALAGADIILNLSASDELIGKHRYLCSLIAQHSASAIAGYVYSGCGYGESTQDVVYGGNAMIYENGQLLASAQRFSMQPQMVTAQIDIEKLRSERRSNSTYTGAQQPYQAVITNAHSVRQHDFVLEQPVNPLPFIPQEADKDQSLDEILSIQAAALAKRLDHTRCRNVVVGISGGLDSTLALLVCVRAFGLLDLPLEGIVGVTMPGFGTTNRTHNNAVTLMQALGVSAREICIADAVSQHFKDIGHDASVHDVTYENSQARERTQILMDLGNKLGALVIGTGDMSELALGWATYNGDHMSMYGVNAGVPKTLIRHLVAHVAQTIGNSVASATLLDIIDTPISPELIPATEQGEISQITEDLVGPYPLHDFFLFYFLRYRFRPAKIFMLAQKAFSPATSAEYSSDITALAGCASLVYDDATIKKWLTVFFRRFFSQQFKRSCLPDGPKVGSVSLSPRGDWRMPSDASAALWLKECEEL